MRSFIIAVHVTNLHPSTEYLFVLSKGTHHRTGNTIETNLKNLNVNQFDLAFEVSWSTFLLLTEKGKMKEKLSETTIHRCL